MEGRNSAALNNLLGCANPNSEAVRYIKAGIRGKRAIFAGAATFARLEMLEDVSGE